MDTNIQVSKGQPLSPHPSSELTSKRYPSFTTTATIVPVCYIDAVEIYHNISTVACLSPLQLGSVTLLKLYLYQLPQFAAKLLFNKYQQLMHFILTNMEKMD